MYISTWVENKNVLYVHMEFYSVLKKYETIKFQETSEITEAKKYKQYILSLMFGY